MSTDGRTVHAARRRACGRAVTIVAAAISAAAFPASARAQWFPPADRVSFEPFVGFRFGGEVEDSESDRIYPIDAGASIGGRVAARWREVGGMLLFSRQATHVRTREGGSSRERRLTIDQWMIGTFREYPQRWSGFRPYVEGAVGATQFSTRDANVDIPSPTRLSIAAGGGVALMPTPNVGIRLAGRGYLTFVRSGTAIFCSAGCSVLFRSDGLLQGEVLAGLIVAF